MKSILISIPVFLIMTGFAIATSLQWDDPAEWIIIEGYTIYFTDGSQQYNKTIGKADLVRADGAVTYPDIEANLNLSANTAYQFYITAYNAESESDPSNTVSYTTAGYAPPTDRLPEFPSVLSGPPAGLIIE